MQQPARDPVLASSGRPAANRRPRVMALFGTRPEAVKVAPVVLALRAAGWAEVIVAVTGQHREMLDQALGVFDIEPDIDLNLMAPGRPLAEQAAAALTAVAGVLRDRRPDLLLVQGDTASAFAGALAAFYERVPVGHIEAGLRTYSLTDPFPEEGNRRLIAVTAALHFAPTERARAALLAEGVPNVAITVTGNTEIDALRLVRESGRLERWPLPPGFDPAPGMRTLLVTLHRREHWGAPMAAMAGALRHVLDAFPDVRLLLPMHRNPVVRAALQPALGDHPRAALVEPLDYLDFITAMAHSYAVLTDSGGVQEAAPSLGVPVLVLREATERPEAVSAGVARLVGTAPERIVAETARLLTDPAARAAMARAVNPFGDGHATERIVDVLARWLRPGAGAPGHREAPLPSTPSAPADTGPPGAP